MSRISSPRETWEGKETMTELADGEIDEWLFIAIENIPVPDSEGSTTNGREEDTIRFYPSGFPIR